MFGCFGKKNKHNSDYYDFIKNEYIKHQKKQEEELQNNEYYFEQLLVMTKKENNTAIEEIIINSNKEQERFLKLINRDDYLETYDTNMVDEL